MSARIPPNIAWPAFIGLLFVIGTVSTLTMVWIARSDGGAQVIDNYYDKAVAWDQTAARQQASDALGWEMTVRLDPDAPPDNRRLVIDVSSEEGTPVTGLDGIVRLYRPEIAGWLAEIELDGDSGHPGEYHLEMPFGRSGLWDVEIEASRDSLHFRQRVRTEIR